MSHSVPRAALVATDETLRETVYALAREADAGLTLGTDFPVSAGDFTPAQLRALQQAVPALVLLDLDPDVPLGIELARHLAGPELGLPVVAIGAAPSTEVLLEVLRAGVAEFLPKPVTPGALRDALRRLAPRLRPPADAPREGRVLVVLGAKGGTGSTTAATNLGIELHRVTGRRVLLVDLDLGLGGIALQLGLRPRFSVVDLAQNVHRVDEELLSSYIERHPSGVHLLPAPEEPDRATGMTEAQVRQVLAALREHYDYVVVDTGKSFGPATLAACAAADEVLLVSTVDLPSLRNVQRTLPVIRRVVTAGPDRIRLVVNRYSADDPVTVKDVERTLELPVFARLANDYAGIIRAINAGKPIVLDGSSAYSRDIRGLAAQMAGAEAARNGAAGGLVGRVTSLFRRRKPAGEGGRSDG